MGDFEVTIERLAATITLHAAGPVDGKTAASLHEPLLAAAAACNATVCLDLARVTYMSNAGLRVLVLAAQALRSRGAQLRLEHVPPHIENLLRCAGFTSFVDVA
jgi:stage II sporulation protein AA (anti-sigma F factor antagonist)